MRRLLACGSSRWWCSRPPPRPPSRVRTGRSLLVRGRRRHLDDEPRRYEPDAADVRSGRRRVAQLVAGRCADRIRQQPHAWRRAADPRHELRWVESLQPVGPVPAINPAWSPDGSKIAFAKPFIGYEIHVMNADGSGAHAVGSPPFTNEGSAQLPSWPPDGTEIVAIAVDCSDHCVGWQLFKFPANGGASQYLSFADWGAPDWSPDDQLVAFTLVVSGTGEPEERHDAHRRRRLHRAQPGWTPSSLVTGWQQDRVRHALYRTRDPRDELGREGRSPSVRRCARLATDPEGLPAPQGRDLHSRSCPAYDACAAPNRVTPRRSRSARARARSRRRITSRSGKGGMRTPSPPSAKASSFFKTIAGIPSTPADEADIGDRVLHGRRLHEAGTR